MHKTIVALYDDYNHAQQAVRELVDNGISRDQISLMANNAGGQFGDVTTGMGETTGTSATAEGAGVGAGIGAALGGIGGLLVGLGALAIPGIGPVIAAGPLAAALGGVAGAGAGAVAGGAAGGILGALTDMGVNDEQASYYAEGVRRGGTLITVRADDHLASQAVDVLNRHNPIDVRNRVSDWQREGWSRFDEAAGPYVSGRFGSERTTGQSDYTSSQSGRNEPGGYYTSSDIDVNPDATRSPDVDLTNDVTDDRGDFTRTGSYTGEPMGTDIRSSSTGYSSGTMDVGMTGDVDYGRYNTGFRNHFDTTYATRGYTYTDYEPAYHYGYDLASDDQYRDWDWDRIEPEARRTWLERYPDNAWEDFKDAIRHSWNEVRNAFR